MQRIEVSVPLPGFIELQDGMIEAVKESRKLVSVPLPGFIELQVPYAVVVDRKERRCFSPVAGIH